MMLPKKVAVKVPATSANLGPGFDCLGMALNIYNEVSVELSDRFGIIVSGEGTKSISRGVDNLVYQSITSVYQHVSQSLPPVLLSCQNRIPLARGLGSSAAAVVGGVVVANLLLGQPLSPEELLQLAAQLEGHADNVAPALFGGCQIVTRDSDQIVHTSIPIPANLQAVLFIPDFEMPTQEMRAALPEQFSREDAVYNLGRIALLVAAFTTGKLQQLRIATQDKLHQPTRQKFFPAMPSLFQAALEAGALGVFLSGSGSTILALVEQQASAVAKAMLRAAKTARIGGKTEIAQPSPLGAHQVN